MHRQWWLMIPVFVILGVTGYLFVRKTTAITSQQAMATALRSEVVQAFFAVDNGRFSSCARRRVVRPCDSDWVTCIDDAWVVEFFVGKECGLIHDGRMDLHLLVDWKGDIISHFPERKYFQDELYCEESYDCLRVDSTEGSLCRNFVFGQISRTVGDRGGSCRCMNHQCGM